MSDQLQTDSVLQSFNDFADPLGLKLSWPNTKLQNVGAGDLPSTILIDGIPVEAVEEFISLGSKQSSNGYCRLDVLCRIGLACSVMNSLQRVWKCSSLSINTKVHLYQALVMSVLLHGAETWTLLVADMKILEAFHMRCQQQILDVRLWAHVSYAEVPQRSGLSTIGDILRHQRLSLFGHVAGLDPGVPAHDALHLMVDIYEGRKPMASRRRPPGHPRNVWLNKVQEDANALLLSTLWRSEIAKGH